MISLLQREPILYSIAIVSSFFLSYWIGSHETVINPDGICYLYSAEEVGKSGLKAAMHLCPQAIWPFYSALIYAVSLISPFDIATNAFMLDSIFEALSVTMFIAMVQSLGGTRRVMWLAALVILMSHQFNNVRQYIIRDHGFWAFYLVSIYCLMQFYKDTSIKSALLWAGSLVVATLFRVEGAIFLLVAPWVAWFNWQRSWVERFRLWLTLNLLAIVAAFCVAGWFVVHPEQTLTQLGRLLEIKYQGQHGLANVFMQYRHMTNEVTTHVLSNAAARDAGKVVFLTGIVWYLVEALNNLSWIYALLVLFAWVCKDIRFSHTNRLVVWGYVFINVTITFIFFAQHLFLAKRYLIGLTLVMMLWVPFALDALFKRRLIFMIAMVGVLVTGVSSIVHFGPNKQYIRDAGDWLAEHIPPKERLYVNDYQLMYYSKHFGTDIFKTINLYKNINTISHGKWKQFNYLAIEFGHERPADVAHVLQELRMPPLAVFVNPRGDRIYIYKVK